MKRIRKIELFALAGLCLGAELAAAQEFRGTILGRVTDTSGGVIPGATVVVTNEQTNVVSKTVTEADGAYAVPFLIPGTYRVEVEGNGFRKFVQSGITIDVNQRATVNVTLEVGTVTETVNVTANAPLLETSTGGMGQVINRAKVESLPLNGRMIFMLNQLAEGVIWQVPTFGATGTSGLRPFDNAGGSAWSLNGGRLTSNEFLLDGAPNSTRGRYNFAPPVDAVDEFKIQTNTYDAQYGRTGGGVVNMTLKSGTNSFHGQIWEFIKYGAWDANNTLNNATGKSKPPHQFNQYGATVTGPFRKDKTFFMATWEGLRERVPFPIRTSVPTVAERNGDFCQSYSDQRTPLVIYDPLTTRPDPSNPGKFIRDQLIDCSNPNKNRIPDSQIDAIAQKILQIYPLPNVLNQRLNNYVNSVNKAKYNYNAELTRIDHVLSAKSKIFGTFYRNHRDEFRSNNGLQGTFANQGEWPQTRENHGVTLDWVYTLSQKSLLNIRNGFTRFTERVGRTDITQFDARQLGFQNFSPPFLPRINLQQFTDIGVGSQGFNTVDNTTSTQANYSRTFSRHTLKFGGEYRNIRSNPETTGENSGHFDFTRDFTRKDPNSSDNTTGNAVASLLLGYPNGGRVEAGAARALQWHYLVLFIQDDLRVTPKLTLNLGFRWDYESPVTERYNRMARGFAFDQTNPLASAVKNAPGVSECPACADLRGGLLFAGVGGVSRGLFRRSMHNFQPRFGAAYALNNKTVIRGGYGLYYQPTGQFGPQTGFFVNTPYFAYDVNGRVGVPERGVNTFTLPFPNGLVKAPRASLGLLTQAGQGFNFDDPNRVVPYIYQYNFSIQREITPNLLLDVAYVGSQTRHLPALGANPTASTPDPVSINEVSAADLAKGSAFLQQRVTNPFTGLLPGSGNNGASVQRQQLLRPFPEFTGIGENAISIGKSWYNAFQMRVEKRLSQGLTFISSYTLSKTMEQLNFLNPQDTVMVRQLTNYDRTHRWVFSGIYNLPFGRGRKFGSNTSGLVDRLIGGWQINWIYTIQSGRPLDEPNLERLGSAKLANQTPDRWFNNCFKDVNGNLKNCQPGESPVWSQRPPFTLRTTPNRFSDIRVPWRPTLDLSLFKNTKINERFALQYHLESFNTLNTVILQAPNTDFTNANFGTIPRPREAIYFPRNIQMALKLYF